jgi:membrane protease YdiL (CAAX protease family)
LSPALFTEGARTLKISMIGDTRDTESFGMGLIIGVALITGAGLGTALSLKRRVARTRYRNVALGDIEYLFPRNAQERRWAVLISVNAGFSEEMFFRLLLPLLLYRVSGNVVAALGIPIIVFGCAHFYQGWKGVAATTVVGALFTAVVLGSGRIWYAMALHALMDLNALLLMPTFSGAWKKR